MQADAALLTSGTSCLSRRLWEAGQQAEGQGVVGVVGAAHVKGIQARWAQAGSPETGRQVAEYCGSNTIAVPTQAGPWINLAAGTSSVTIIAAGFSFWSAFESNDNMAIMTYTTLAALRATTELLCRTELSLQLERRQRHCCIELSNTCSNVHYQTWSSMWECFLHCSKLQQLMLHLISCCVAASQQVLFLCA